jgi:hypothetical protein
MKRRRTDVRTPRRPERRRRGPVYAPGPDGRGFVEVALRLLAERLRSAGPANGRPEAR